MIVETTRAVADWLGNATYGLNARLAGMSYDGSDAAPTGTYTVVDATRSSFAAADQWGESPPYCRVRPAPINTAIGNAVSFTHDADVPVEIVLYRTASTPFHLYRDLGYSLRALLYTLEQLFNDAATGAVAARTRNSVQLQTITRLEGLIDAINPDDHIGTATLVCSIACRDLTA